MSNRLTNRWTNTAAEAFGGTGERGRTAEILVMQILESASIEAQDFEEDYKMQVAGIDLISNGLSIDVKGNLYKGHFYIENGTQGWLFNVNKTSNIILHVDPATKDVVWYHRSVAQSKIRQVVEHKGSSKSLIKIDQNNFRPEFMSRSWEELYTLLRT